MVLLFFIKFIISEIPLDLPSPPSNYVLYDSNKCGSNCLQLPPLDPIYDFLVFPQYQIVGRDWQDEPIFTDLEPDTPYQINAKYHNYNPSSETTYYYIPGAMVPGDGSGIYSSRNNLNHQQRNKLSNDEKEIKMELLYANDTSIIIKSIPPIVVKLEAEYQYKEDLVWKYSTKFENLPMIAGMNHIFKGRYKALNFNEGVPSSFFTQKTPSYPQNCNKQTSLECKSIYHGIFLYIIFMHQKM